MTSHHPPRGSKVIYNGKEAEVVHCCLNRIVINVDGDEFAVSYDKVHKIKSKEYEK